MTKIRTNAAKRLIQMLREHYAVAPSMSLGEAWLDAIAAVEDEEAEAFGNRALREAAQAALDHAEPDDDFEGEFMDYLVPFEHIEALRAALRGDTPCPECGRRDRHLVFGSTGTGPGHSWPR